MLVVLTAVTQYITVSQGAVLSNREKEDVEMQPWMIELSLSSVTSLTLWYHFSFSAHLNPSSICLLFGSRDQEQPQQSKQQQTRPQSSNTAPAAQPCLRENIPDRDQPDKKCL